MSSMKRELSDLSGLELKLAYIQLSESIVYKECEEEEGPLMACSRRLRAGGRHNSITRSVVRVEAGRASITTRVTKRLSIGSLSTISYLLTGFIDLSAIAKNALQWLLPSDSTNFGLLQIHIVNYIYWRL